MITEIPVRLPEGRCHSIFIGKGILEHASGLVDSLCIGADAFIVTDSNVGPLYLESLRRGLLAGETRDAGSAVFPAGEASKTLDTWTGLVERLIEFQATGTRKTYVAGLGGGVVGDVAGFVAATFRRGTPVVQAATSLIAMVDSAIGGKTGVDHPNAKNLIGAFHQPRLILIDPLTLGTLPPRELRCGMAEVIKYGVIKDPDLFERLGEGRQALCSGDIDAFLPVIERCARIKADYVERDEFDRTGIRAELNLGHTFGHAIETVTAYSGAYQHGEAVAVGMIAACDAAARLGIADRSVLERVHGMVSAFGLPTTVKHCDPDRMVEAMRLDKKNISGRHRLVLPRRIGEATVVDGVDEAVIREAIAGRIEG